MCFPYVFLGKERQAGLQRLWGQTPRKHEEHENSNLL